MSGDKHTLFINRTDSRCGNCGRGAAYRELTHDTICEYSPRSGEPGCGIRWVFVSSDYSGEAIREAAKRCRPDLAPDFMDEAGHQ